MKAALPAKEDRLWMPSFSSWVELLPLFTTNQHSSTYQIRSALLVVLGEENAPDDHPVNDPTDDPVDGLPNLP